MWRSLLIILILAILPGSSFHALACLPPENPNYCDNINPGPCNVDCCTDGGAGGGAGGGSGGGAGGGGGGGGGGIIGIGGGGGNISTNGIPVVGGGGACFSCGRSGGGGGGGSGSQSCGGCPGANGSGNGALGGNPQAFSESSHSSFSSGLAKPSYTVNSPGIITTYAGDIAAGKYFTTFKLSLLNMPTNGRFSLSPGLTYCSDYHIFAQNENGDTMLGPGWFCDFEIFLGMRTGGAEGDLLLRTASGHSKLMVKQQDGSWKSQVIYGQACTMTKISSYYYLKFDDNRTEYKFNWKGKICRAMDGLGNELIFTYNGSDQLTRIASNSTVNGSDIDDRYLTFTHTSGRCTKITASDGREMHFTYDANDPSRLTHIKYKKSSVGTLYTLYEFVYGTDAAAFYAIEEVKTNRADGTFGKLYQYTYDYTNHGATCTSRVTGKKDADGNNIVQVAYSSDGGDPYEPTIVKITNPSGAYSKYFMNLMRTPEKIETYNSSNQVKRTFYQTRYTWDDGTSAFTKGTQTSDVYVTYTYQTENGDAFDARNARIARIDYPDDTYITNAYNASGYVSSSRDARGKITQFTYDANGLLETDTNPLNQTSNYDYDSRGRLISFAGPDHLTTTYTYTDEGQIKTVRVPGPLTTTYNYNDYGWVTSIVDPNSRAITYTYNDFGMATSFTNSENKDWDYTYTNGGIVTSTTDPKNNTSEYTYNKKGFLTKVANALDKEMSFSYNSLGLMDTVKDQRGKFVTYTYDCFGRMTEEKNDDGITTTYTYYDEGCGSCGGGAGKIKTKTDGKHATLTYEYDIMVRLEKVEYPSSEFVSFTYDANGNRLTMKDTRINYGDETFSWEYDDLSRVTKEIYPDDEYITHAYTISGSRASMRRPDNTHLKYNYDSRGRLSTILDTKDSYAFTYTYNNDNTLDKIDYPNLTFDEFEYDSLYRISNITSTFTDTNPDTVWYSVDYTYDDVGNKTKAEWDGYSGSPFKYSKYYTYDNIYQLLTEKKMNQAETSRLYEYQYQFDNAGNRTQMKYFDGSTTATTTYHYNDLNQMWLRCKTYDYYYTYDDNGNLTIEDYEAGGYQREFTWNEDNRLKYVDNVVDSKEVEYTYDPLGRRIMRKDVDNNTYTYYYYDGLTVLAEKKKVGAGNPTWDKLFTVAGGAIGNILRSNLNYYHYDAMGNLVFISDFDGTPSQSFEQEAYGNVKSGSQSGYHLTTKEYDSIGELYYFNRRWYDPQIGRFISKDIIFNINEINLYVFCLNNPISLMDVKGSNSDWREVNPIEYPWYIRVFRCLLPDLFEEEALHTAYVCSQLPGIAETIDSNNECPVDCQLYDPPPGREGLCRTLGNLWGDFRDWIGF